MVCIFVRRSFPSTDSRALNRVEQQCHLNDHLLFCFGRLLPPNIIVRELVQAAKGHLRGATGDNSSEAVGWEGSPAWTADQFQLHFEAIVNTAAG